MTFDLDAAIQTANSAVLKEANRHLTDVELLILRGAWERAEYDQIAAQNQYATSYISQDVAPKLWRLLTAALGEKVRKSNFKAALKRQWSRQHNETSLPEPSPTSGAVFPSALGTPSPLGQSTRPPTMGAPPSHPPSTLNSLLGPEIYVERPPTEAICFKTLQQPGALLRVKAPQLMGKTSLMTRVLTQISHEGYRTVNLSFQLADRQTHFSHLNKFLRWFCLNLSRELGLPHELDAYWDEEGMGAKVSCTTYFEAHLLGQTEQPLVICLDDVDLLFPHPEIYEDFFGLLRSWYEKARSRPLWKRLRLALVHATDVYIRLNMSQSPFNVGLPIELSDFTPDQALTLAQQNNLSVSLETIQPLIDLVGGHPYLLQQAFTHLARDSQIALDQLLAEATTDAGLYGSHLREYWLELQRHTDLAHALKIAVNETTPVQLEPLLAYQLQRMGLVTLLGNQVEPRCNLYRHYFMDRLQTLG